MNFIFPAPLPDPAANERANDLQECPFCHLQWDWKRGQQIRVHRIPDTDIIVADDKQYPNKLAYLKHLVEEASHT